MIGRYAVALEWVLARQRATLLVFVLTLILTAMLYIFIPKGFFPTQDTGVIQAITQAPQAASYQAVAAQQQALAKKILENPDVESLTSFIGVDGTNITLNSGRMLINLKPRDDRSNTSSEIIRTIQSEVADIPGIRLYMQPVQDLTIDSTVSPTQYQFMLTDPNPSEFAEWVPKLVDRLQHTDILTDVATDLQQNGQSVYIEIDRPTATRFGITPATVDNALYDAFGQRIISTIFTQSNQYRVILEAQPSDAHYSDILNDIYLPSSTASSGQVPLPSAGVGALLSLMITGNNLDIIGIIGIVLLIGIVKKNAIMMIDFALEAERDGGKSPREAIFLACLLRFRPILMTTMAALLGALPLMLGWGAGSELRRSLGIAIVGGLIVSQMLTLFTTPVIYLGFESLGQRLRKRFGHHFNASRSAADEFGLHVHLAQAQERAQGLGGSGHQPLARAARRCRRYADLSTGGAGHPRRRTTIERAVSVHAVLGHDR